MTLTQAQVKAEYLALHGREMAQYNCDAFFALAESFKALECESYCEAAEKIKRHVHEMVEMCESAESYDEQFAILKANLAPFFDGEDGPE